MVINGQNILKFFIVIYSKKKEKNKKEKKIYLYTMRHIKYTGYYITLVCVLYCISIHF